MRHCRYWFIAAIAPVVIWSGQKVSAATFSAASLFASGSAVGAGVSGPDSITIGNGSVWVSYVPSGTSSSDFSGTSTIVQYNMAGAILRTYAVPGSVDGLKIDPSTSLVWALQNQDGNSRITIIDPVSQTLTPFFYTPPVSGTQGFDDLVFSGGKIYLSYSNPSVPTDPVLQTLGGLTNPLVVTPLATNGANPATLSDPDSLKQDTHGNLVLTSGSDGALDFFSTAGTFSHALSITSGGQPVTGLDDSLFPSASSGTIYFTDTATNSVYKVNASNLAPDSIYASVGSVHSIGQVDPVTGAFTSVISDGATNSSPHGIAFLASPEPGSAFLFAGGSILLLVRCVFTRRRSKIS